MSWERVAERDRLTEWRRSDGNATIRLRERATDGWTVRLDRMEQAPEGSAYRREDFEEREAAETLVEEWKAEFDVA